MENTSASSVGVEHTELKNTIPSASALNASAYYQKRHKWARVLRIRDCDVPAEVVWAFSELTTEPDVDQINSARKMVKQFYLER